MMESEPGQNNAMTPTSEASEAWAQAAKAALPVPFRPDGPPLGFEFDPVPQEKRLAIENLPKSKKMVIGEYDAEAAEDGSIQEIRKREHLCASSHKRKTFVVVKPDGSRTARMSLSTTPDSYTCYEKEEDKEHKRRDRKLSKDRLNREHQRERDRQQKEFEKRMKAQQKEEEKQKIQLERDMKKLERDMERERKAEEKKRQQEMRKREKDLQKALAVQVKVAQKAIQKELEAGPPDDLDLEWEELTKQMDADASMMDRPPFPPSSLELEPAFPQLGNKIGGDLMTIWGFVQSFNDIIALPLISINTFVHAFFVGQTSMLLSTIHIVLIRLIQSDMEESHHIVLTQGSGGTSNFMDRALVTIAGTLDEAISWGFDVDAWRAHLNIYTWPEILRQIAIAAGYGPKRSRGYRDKKANEDGEIHGKDESRIGYGLKMPSRLTQGTVKAAAWQVLSSVGPDGLTISEIASRIQKQGLRDLRTSKTPEATVAGALSRDAVFCRVAPATYALHAVLPTAENQTQQMTEGEDALGKETKPDETDEESILDDTSLFGEPWIRLLSNTDYDDLSLENRLEMFKTLCNMALESPTIRACLDARLEREIVEQRRLDIEAKAENRARREQAAEETQRKLMELENSGITESPTHLNSTVKSMITENLQPVVPECLALKGEISKACDHIRLDPLGRDRRFNRYWSFTGTENRTILFIEINGQFKVLKNREQLDSLMNCLETKGAREGPLHFALEKYRQELRQEWDDWSEPVETMDLPSTNETPPFNSIHLFAKKWTNPQSFVTSTNQTLWMDQLKTLLSIIEHAIPFAHKLEFDSENWRQRLETIENLDDFLQSMGQLEASLDPQILHPSYNRNPRILYGAWREACDPQNGKEEREALNWLPRNYAAAFFHLFCFDASLCFHGSSAGRETMLSYKYVQKPFVHELNPHIDVSQKPLSIENALQAVSVEPLRLGGKLTVSAFPVIQKGTPVQKQPIPFNFEVDEMRHAVEAAERSGMLYANIQLTQGRSKNTKTNGSKGIKCLTIKRPQSELEDDVSTSGIAASSDDPDVRYDYADDETIDRSEISRDDVSDM